MQSSDFKVAKGPKRDDFGRLKTSEVGYFRNFSTLNSTFLYMGMTRLKFILFFIIYSFFHVFPFQQLNHFWNKLSVERVYFNACGIFCIDRSIFLSVDQIFNFNRMNKKKENYFHFFRQIAASITTYLVLLLQF